MVTLGKVLLTRLILGEINFVHKSYLFIFFYFFQKKRKEQNIKKQIKKNFFQLQK